jgi:hypothetical protein
MHYRIEFLTESTDPNSVCFMLDAMALNLDAAQIFAENRAAQAVRDHNAQGYQIRNESGGIVALEDFAGW